MVAGTRDGGSKGQKGDDCRWYVVSFGKDGNVFLNLSCW